MRNERKEVDMSEREGSDSATILISFLLGGIVGAGISLLFAPYSGRKMRGKIADLADDAKEYATDYAKKLKDKVA
jgi:gas vesicle protein